MTNKEAIKIIDIAIAEVEWEYPLDYATAFTKAKKALQQPKKLKLDLKDLYSSLSCALMHDIDTCNSCNLCEGNNAAERRMILVEKLSKVCGMPLPWKDEK